MIKVRAFLYLGLAGFLAVASSATAADSIWVMQVGDGSTALNTSASALILKKLDITNGSVLDTINLPTAVAGANQPITARGSSTSEGHLNLSSDGNYLVFAGYGAAPGTLAVAQTDSASTPRVIGRVTVADKTVDTTTALTDAYTGIAANDAGFRSVASDNGTNFWTAGTRGFGAPAGSDGVRYTTLGSTTTTSVQNFPSGPSNTRIVDIFNGQLYMSSASTGIFGVSTIGSGLPQSGPESPLILNGMPTSTGPSTYDFWFKDANTVYVADDRSQASGGGIQKWEFNSGAGAWGLTYTLNVGADGARGLDGTIVGGQAVLYATTGGALPRVISVTDTNASATFNILATSATNTAFRGISFVQSAVAPGVAGDYNGNGTVDAADYVIWRNGGPLSNEVSGVTPGTVTPEDYDAWRARFGNNSGSGSGSAVPEPASVVLLLFGVAAICGRRRAA